MTVLALEKRATRDFNSAYEHDFDDLIWGRRAGHMGHHEYVDRSMPLWTKFLEDNATKYYTPGNEIDLIKRAAQASAALLGDRPVTLVSRGCGTKFLPKEGELIQHFRNVVGVVYLDRSDAALEQSIDEGRRLLPDAWHKAIRADIFDPALRYPVDGTEVGTSFGITLLNIEGFPTAPPPKDAYVRNLSAIQAQMRTGAHFIMTADHNQDRKSIEQAYAGQGDFAKDMLRRTGCMNPNDVDFIVKFHGFSRTLSHGFRFHEDTLVRSRSRSGLRNFRTGDTLWFNNSVKPTLAETMEWNRSSGFTYARPDIPMDAQARLGWHHLIKN
ncbi:MAG: L-histidine N(alpha)-methyltransferase [Planctomycetes bacterium]|nr:L-histidine N(alpha)-methyltransferase [Planctomycetota bacterium]